MSLLLQHLHQFLMHLHHSQWTSMHLHCPHWTSVHPHRSRWTSIVFVLKARRKWIIMGSKSQKELDDLFCAITQSPSALGTFELHQFQRFDLKGLGVHFETIGIIRFRMSMVMSPITTNILLLHYCGYPRGLSPILACHLRHEITASERGVIALFIRQ